ncbi:MAG: alpha/beta fold hydrolase, partial [Asticcacaulis sp.]
MFTKMTREEKDARIKRDRPWMIFAVLAVSASAVFSALAAKAETVERARFTVEVVGKGPDVILIPGLVSDRAVWADTVKSLSSSHRLHLVQVRGFNGVPTGANAEGPVLEPLVEDLNGYIRDKGLSGPVIVGHSMGGATGLMLSARHPQAVKQVVVVDSAPFMPALINPAATAETAKAQVAPILNAVRTMPAEQFAAQQKMGMRMQTKDPAKADMVADWSVKSDR